MAIRPSSGNITSGFGMRNGRMHLGEDIGWVAGRKLVAPISGKVVFASNSGGYGKLLKIISGVTEIRLAHMASFAVKVGDSVTEGDYVGEMGSTGNSDGVHCHWEVIINGVYVDPAQWLLAIVLSAIAITKLEKRKPMGVRIIQDTKTSEYWRLGEITALKLAPSVAIQEVAAWHPEGRGVPLPHETVVQLLSNVTVIVNNLIPIK